MAVVVVVVGGVADGVVGYSFEHEAVEEFKFHLIRLVRFAQGNRQPERQKRLGLLSQLGFSCYCC